LELFGGKNHILAIRPQANNNREHCIWQLGEIASRLFAHTLAHIRRQSLVAFTSFFLASRIALEHFIKNITTHCRQIHSVLSKLSNRSQTSNVPKKSKPAVSLWRGILQS
jgi:hypothetical protein